MQPSIPDTISSVSTKHNLVHLREGDLFYLHTFFLHATQPIFPDMPTFLLG